MGFASGVLGIRPSERRTVALVATLMFVTLAGITIGESAINALFFDRIGTQALPLMYLAQAGATLVAMFALTTVLERVVASCGLHLVAAAAGRGRGGRARRAADRRALDLSGALDDGRVRHPLAGDRSVGDRRNGRRHPSGQAAVPDLRSGGHPGSRGRRAAHASARRCGRRGEPAAGLGRRSPRRGRPVPAVARAPRNRSSDRGPARVAAARHQERVHLRPAEPSADRDGRGRGAVLRPVLLPVPAVRDGLRRSASPIRMRSPGSSGWSAR